jgi:hypothetical protein
MRLYQPFLYRIVGFSTIYFISTNKYPNNFKMMAIPNGKDLFILFRELVEIIRNEKGIKDYDIHNM